MRKTYFYSAEQVSVDNRLVGSAIVCIFAMCLYAAVGIVQKSRNGHGKDFRPKF